MDNLAGHQILPIPMILILLPFRFYINFPMIVSRHPFAAGEDAMASSNQWPN
jgi:hypothetical protein